MAVSPSYCATIPLGTSSSLNPLTLPSQLSIAIPAPPAPAAPPAPTPTPVAPPADGSRIPSGSRRPHHGRSSGCTMPNKRSTLQEMNGSKKKRRNNIDSMAKELPLATVIKGKDHPTPFKLDIDELLNEFTGNGSTTLADMKKIWLTRKFTFIFESIPKTSLAFFMQSLYAHTLSHMVSSSSLSQRLGVLYCLYCLYETQPFKPPFKIYLSLGELKMVKSLVVDAKENNIRVVRPLVKRMMERSTFLFGSVDLVGSYVNERINEINKLQTMGLQFAYEKLLANTPIEEYLHMDLSMELDLKRLKKISTDYAKAKEIAIKEAGGLIGVDDIKHIAERTELIGDSVEKISEEWNAQKEELYQKTGVKFTEVETTDRFDRELESLLTQY